LERRAFGAAEIDVAKMLDNLHPTFLTFSLSAE